MGRWGNSISIDVDVDLNDVYSEMNTSDRKEMTSWLYKDGHLDEYIKKKNLTSPINGWKWKDVCDKLANNQLRLTNEEEEIIKKIADRL